MHKHTCMYPCYALQRSCSRAWTRWRRCSCSTSCRDAATTGETTVRNSTPSTPKFLLLTNNTTLINVYIGIEVQLSPEHSTTLSAGQSLPNGPEMAPVDPSYSGQDVVVEKTKASGCKSSKIVDVEVK